MMHTALMLLAQDMADDSHLIGRPFVDARITIPIALLAFLGVVIYWRLLRRSQLPRTQKRIRRANCVVQWLLIPALTFALSFVDFDHQPSAFIIAWLSVVLLLTLTVALALLDTWYTWRQHRTRRAQLRAQALDRLKSSRP